MSACFVLRQAHSVHLMTDAMAYEADGTVVMNSLNKAVPLATLPAVISTLGPMHFLRQFTARIEQDFRSFDDFVDAAEYWLQPTFQGLADVLLDGDAMTVFYVIGWHAGDNRPGAFFANLWTDDSSKMAEMRATDPEGCAAADVLRGKLQEIPVGHLSGSPFHGEDSLDEAGFKIRRADDYVPAVDLLHLTEIARQHVRDDGTSRQGGKAILSTVTASGISQRVVHHWTDDDAVVGDKLRPEPIDWHDWRVKRLLPAEDTAAMSRLQRERMEKKASKGTLRVVPNASRGTP